MSIGEHFGAAGILLDIQNDQVGQAIKRERFALDEKRNDISTLYERYAAVREIINPTEREIVRVLKNDIITALREYVDELIKIIEPEHTSGFLHQNGIREAASKANDSFEFATICVRNRKRATYSSMGNYNGDIPMAEVYIELNLDR